MRVCSAPLQRPHLQPSPGLGCGGLPCLPGLGWGVWAQGPGVIAGQAHAHQSRRAGAADGAVPLGVSGVWARQAGRRLAAALLNKITDAGVACAITQHQDVVGEDGPSGVRGLRRCFGVPPTFPTQGVRARRGREPPPTPGPEGDRRGGSGAGSRGGADRLRVRGRCFCPGPAGQWGPWRPADLQSRRLGPACPVRPV